MSDPIGFNRVTGQDKQTKSISKYLNTVCESSLRSRDWFGKFTYSILAETVVGWFHNWNHKHHFPSSSLLKDESSVVSSRFMLETTFYFIYRPFSSGVLKLASKWIASSGGGGTLIFSTASNNRNFIKTFLFSNLTNFLAIFQTALFYCRKIPLFVIGNDSAL